MKLQLLETRNECKIKYERLPCINLVLAIHDGYFTYFVINNYQFYLPLFCYSIINIYSTTHPTSLSVVIGTDDGHLLALNGDSGGHVVTVRICGAALNAVAFDKAGDNLAVGAANGSVYLYKVCGLQMRDC